MIERVQGLREFHRAKSGVAAEGVWQAPGRVNLLGEHTDYSGGFCMPAALSFNTLVAASRRRDGRLVLHSMDIRGETYAIGLDQLRETAKLPVSDEWHSYCAGVAWRLMQVGLDLEGGMDLSLTGNVPSGAGLSSSASVEVGVATALLGLTGVTMAKAEVALACQKAENDFVGAPCGIMDQYISAAGVKGNALAIDTRALTVELAPIPEELRLVVCNSMVKHSVAGGEYAGVRKDVEVAAAALHRRDPRIVQLRDATLEDLAAGRQDMPEPAYKRGRHVISDSQRVLDGVAALRAGDAVEFGRLMTEAHASYRDDFGASCRECDVLVELALGLGGCLGSRLTGGGFGGCTVSLVEAEAADAFAVALGRAYTAATGIVPQVFVCEIADGAGAIA